MDGFAATTLGGSIPQALGTLGLILYVGAYLSLILGVIRSDNYLSVVLTLLAALCIIFALVNGFTGYSLTNEIAWVTISIIGMVRVYLVHKYFRLTDDERAAAQRLVPELSKVRLRKLLRLGAWTTAAPGTVLTREGEPVEHLIFVADGTCRIEIGGALVATIGTGGLIGEMTYHTGAPATATVTVETPARLLSFERHTLGALLDRNEDIRAALEQSVAGDLRGKLAATSRALADGRRGSVRPFT
jgi:hypothetical protein